MMTTTTPAAEAVKLSPAERFMLEALDGQPWQADELTDEALKEAQKLWLRLMNAAGFSGPGGWFTTSETSPKMGKNPYPTVGVTLLSAAEGLAIWDDLPWATKRQIARALDTNTWEVRQKLRATLCPRSTSGCREVCVTFHSANARLRRNHESRLAKTLFHIFRPGAAFAITGDGLRSLHAASGSDSRWRVNVSDDVRWEYLAPGLFDLGVPGYAYTKWAPEERPGFPGFSVVYSVTERTTDESIVQLVSNQHRAAVVFDVPAKKLPDTWNGMRVVDGDSTDDLFDHEPGTIVGLSAKGPNLGFKAKMRESGFSRAA